MSKILKLKSARIYELSTVIDAIQPKELDNLKDIRLAANIVKDLQESCKDYTDKIIAVTLKQQDDLREFQKKYNADAGKLETQKEKDDYLAKVNGEYQAEMRTKYQKEFDATQKEADKDCEVELSDEKHAKLVDFFKKFAPKAYIKKDAFLEVADALEIKD